MSLRRFSFDRFVLDPENRRLHRDGQLVPLNSRYFDALVLLVREQGQLVSKARFLEQVWRGKPVTDEAITQCVRALRKTLGDDASNPRFIETVPKHGYRFVARVEQTGACDRPTQIQTQEEPRVRVFDVAAACALGGGIAGIFGGLLYGLAAALEAPQHGTLSTLIVVTATTILIATIGGAGVGLGIAAARLSFPDSWLASGLGGAIGGLIVGASVKLLGTDALNLFFGASPGDITGGVEGTLLGGAVGLGVWLTTRRTARLSSKHTIGAAALGGAAAGIVIALLGGRLMVGSLDLLARQFAGSRLRFDHVGQWLGEENFGDITQAVTGGLEGALFAASIVGTMLFAQQRR